MKRKAHSTPLFRLVLAIVLGLMLAGTAIVKIIYPSPLLHDFFLGVSFFEIALALALAIFWRRWEIWALMILVFTTFGGYSLYAATLGLPCRCLGVAVTLPRATSLIVNILIIFLCWTVLRAYSLRTKTIRMLVIWSCILGVVGFISASYLYYIKF